mmetsp:Transcript_38624/g.111058  ORF Transcript_38624/g.111058 Transcript_38624/m.111058 type:complete len:296 (-) Transcript_38624:1047-1934(-)
MRLVDIVLAPGVKVDDLRKKAAHATLQHHSVVELAQQKNAAVHLVLHRRRCRHAPRGVGGGGRGRPELPKQGGVGLAFFEGQGRQLPHCVRLGKRLRELRRLPGGNGTSLLPRLRREHGAGRIRVDAIRLRRERGDGGLFDLRRLRRRRSRHAGELGHLLLRRLCGFHDRRNCAGAAAVRRRGRCASRLLRRRRRGQRAPRRRAGAVMRLNERDAGRLARLHVAGLRRSMAAALDAALPRRLRPQGLRMARDLLGVEGLAPQQRRGVRVGRVGQLLEDRAAVVDGAVVVRGRGHR